MQSLISRKWDLIELTDAWNAAAVGCFLLMIQQAHQLHWWESKWLLFGKISYCSELVAYFSCVHMWLCVQVSAVGSRQHRTPFQSEWGHHQNSVSNCGWRQSARWGMRQCNFRQVNYPRTDHRWLTEIPSNTAYTYSVTLCYFYVQNKTVCQRGCFINWNWANIIFYFSNQIDKYV